jgi:CubicO group peptidase (beta-lactamase class C family)
MKFFALLLLLLGASACASDTAETVTPIDAGSTGDWQVMAPDKLGLDKTKLAAARAYAFQDKMNTQGVVVIKDGYLVAEWYAPGADKTSWGTSWSVAKSFTSALLGIAWGDGLLSSLDVTMGTFIAEWGPNDERAAMTLRDVMTMSSGLHWDETYKLDPNDISEVAEMVLDSDPLSIPVSQPLESEPGTVWEYSSGDTMLLGKVLEELTGKNATALARERLVVPLGIKQFDWWEDGNGHTYTFCCVDATARDFAKFGQLYLQEGVWGSKQIIPTDWVRMTVEETANSNPGYGLQWWLNDPEGGDNYPSLPESAYFALGHDTQLIGVFPDENMVIVRIGLYVKPEGPAVATESLFGNGLLSDGLGATGSTPPGEDWDDDEFFRLILDARVQ